MMFGSERTPDSAEEVLRRDSLHDPYAWRPAAVRLREHLASIGHRYLEEYPDAPMSALPALVAEAVCSAFRDESSGEFWPEELLDALEPASCLIS